MFFYFKQNYYILKSSVSFSWALMTSGYNKGDIYEQKIFEILQNRNLLSPNSNRAGAGGGADLKFIHLSQEYNLEVKLDLKADYGQKTLGWKEGIWFWNVQDETTNFYTSIGVIEYVNRKNIIPYRYTINKADLDKDHRSSDQKIFEDYVDIEIRALHSYYAEKNCFYIQIGGYGFYHLQEDILNLGTPQFNCNMKLRLRAKTVHSFPVHQYGFYATLKPVGKPQKSIYDIEQKENRAFPLIKP
ncbi:MAG: hypothetical protein AUK43_08825 [Oscillatoriales cyanobacterium CG2_30_40_61]|nr:MAG: hypothetical protein AUK43_08825 [Oscillatoriales cyanobacterium CG2_30_40_61]